ncbi:MAG: NUDIX domain-containing protein [Gammaproteobacteria bacterium]
MENKYFPTFTKNDYELVEREVLYQGIFRIARYKIRYRLFNGGFSDVVSREVFERKSAAAILPYDPVLDRLVLIEQIRPGVMNSGQSPWVIEIVAGILGKDEAPEDVAKREAIEEANCDILDIYPISEYFVSPGGSDEFISIYIGRTDASQAGGIFGLPEESEDIRAFTVSSDEAFALLKQGELKNAPTIIAIQWLQLNRAALRNLWQVK